MWAYLVGLGVVALILVTSHLPRSGHNPASSFVDGDGQESGGMWRRHLLDQEEDADPFAGTNCTPPAIEEFPRPIIPQYVRVKGGLLVHLLIAAYMFLGLSIVCDDYFVPALERMVESLQMSQDVAGATFMAAGSSAPELATAVIGVFIAKVCFILLFFLPFFSNKIILLNAGRHWNQRRDRFCRVQHHVRHQRVRPLFRRRHLPQLVAAGPRLHRLFRGHFRPPLHHLQRSRDVVRVDHFPPPLRRLLRHDVLQPATGAMGKHAAHTHSRLRPQAARQWRERLTHALQEPRLGHCGRRRQTLHRREIARYLLPFI